MILRLRVLMGHIDLARTVLPAGTSDYIMDYASRQPLYRFHIDYSNFELLVIIWLLKQITYEYAI